MANYKDVFLTDQVQGKLSQFFNQNPPDANPILLFVFMLALQTQRRPGDKYGNLEFRKGLLSEL
jgi:hypothetical protein